MDYGALRQYLADPVGHRVKKYAVSVITDTRLKLYGIPMRELRKTARTLAGEDWQELLHRARWDSFEEVMVLGLAVAYAPGCFGDKEAALERVLPHLDSWAHTDSIAPTVRVRQAERECLWDFAVRCLKSDREYTVRFGVLVIKSHFLSPEWMERAVEQLTGITDRRYYVCMAVAWTLAELAVTAFERVETILREGELPSFIQNKTIQKIRESDRIAPEQKEWITRYKRKETNDETDSGD